MEQNDRFKIITPNDLPDYRSLANQIAEASWPEFMMHDPIVDEHWHELFERFIEFQFAMLDTNTGRMAAMGNSIPFHWDRDLSELPDGGWDWVFLQAVQDHKSGITPNIQSAIQVAIHPEYQERGLSGKMVNAMRAIGKSKGFQYLVAPVRPSQKSQYPLTDIDRYITWKTDEGLPFDAWLRVHAHAGAKIIRACHESMVIQNTRHAWEEWTGMKFPESGKYVVPGALYPLEIIVEKDEGIYVEPNVWMVHQLD